MGKKETSQQQSTSSRTDAFVQLTQHEHILLRAETYLGSKEPETVNVYIPELVPANDEKTDNDEKTKKETAIRMVQQDVIYVPAFFKIFDEIIVNAADNKVKNPKTCDLIKVTIDPDNHEISVFNNGKGIPVEIHEKYNCYVPELIFGRLLSGSNFNDEEKRITGGRNGYGAKLTNIYSVEFTVETHDSIAGKTYKQKWSDNMTKCGKARITEKKKEGKDYTKVTFKPDLAKLNMTSIDEGTLKMLRKRVYDLTGSLSDIKVFLNGERIKIKDFKDYISTYLSMNESAEKPKVIYERFSDRWEVAVAMTDSGSFQQVSFVNSIATTKGGTHVSYIGDQIVNHVLELLKKKDAKMTVKPAQIRNQMFLFVNCLIENPTFDSQMKEFMKLPASKFGSSCTLSDAFLKKVAKLGIVESTMELIREKDEKNLKKTDGTKRTRLTGIVKLHDANNAGTKKAKDCTLYLVEGESAMTFALTGIPVVKNGRDYLGAYSLRGKLLNVRDASAKQKLENTEITQLKQILGLQEGKVYTSVDSLRYGHICCLTDSDEDGNHIKGLILNWLDSSFPSLLKLPGFVLDFISPIVKCVKARESILFYNLKDYTEWKERNNKGHGWEITYFKGLGTSESEDVKRYFSSIDRHLKRFRETSAEDSEHLDLVFSKKRANDRKKWLERFSKDVVFDDTQKVISISDFIDKKFINFSMYDNIRSIPSVVDGLKPGQRKILYTAFKTKLKNKVKVAQFAGEVAKLTEYRHGEQSLCETIVNLAQDFVGANNISLLEPKGAFGTRRRGGKDAAAPRYIYTMLKDITRKIYHPADDSVLTYQQEDGEEIEPEFYVPIIPMVLVNGAEGIGSGYSTTVLNYNPNEIVDLLIARTRDSSFRFPAVLTPWYKGFTGKIKAIKEDEESMELDGVDNVAVKQVDKWSFSGKVELIRGKKGLTLDITELPVHTWTASYKDFLEEKVAKGEIKDYKEYHTDTSVHFSLTASEDVLERIYHSPTFMKDFKLVTTKRTSNMMLFNSRGQLKHYKNVGEILEDFYSVRIEYYHKRKSEMLRVLQEELKYAENRARFIAAVISGDITIMKQSKKDIVSNLEKGAFDEKAGNFDYLLLMPLHTLSIEKINELEAQVVGIKEKIEKIAATSEEEMYRFDLVAIASL